VPPIPPGQTLALCHTIDDGAAFYIDGELAFRYNLTNSLPIYSTNAAATPTPGDGDAAIVCVPVSLTAGEHLIAVEVHQAASAADNADMIFGTELRFVDSPAPIRITGPSVENLHSLGWNRDPLWDLVEGTSIEGPYTTVAEYPISSYVIPAASTNRFYQLRFNGR